MDNQNQQTTSDDQTTNPQPVVPPAQTLTTANQQDKPKLNISSKEAQSLLAMNNLLGAQQPKTKLPVKLLIAAVGLIAFAIIVSSLVGSVKPGDASKSSGVGLPNQSDPTNSSEVTNQINQDEKACSNPVDAATVC